ncbi:MAG TPA: Hsp33 family molecular chaperone HslO [Pyrinomonadaceae bacterium]|nr:Hsp33 family molecular chaperone HslO [Pyrinomonadaceae bacterium]
MDELIQGTAADGMIRVFATVTTGILSEAVRRHGTSPTASAAFGRALTGTLLLGATFKDYDRLTVRIDGNGPIGGIVAETSGNGSVRGYVKDPTAELPPSSNGKFDVGGLIGEGTFYVIRESGFDIGLHKEPYVGSVPIVSGEIAEDFAYYLLKSEQIPSAVLLGVLLENSEPYVAASGGVLIQMLPGANEHLITMIEDTIKHSPHITSIIREGAGPDDLLRQSLGEIGFTILDRSPVVFQCNCSLERARVLISSLGQAEVRSMLNEDRGARMTCGFCNEEYVLTESDLETILAE